MTVAGVPGLLKFQIADSANNVGAVAIETATILGSPTAGTLAVTYSGQGAPYTTPPITFGVTGSVLSAACAAAIQAALNALPNAPLGGWTVAAAGTGIGFSAQPASYQGPIPLLSVDASLLTPAATANVVMTTPGVAPGPNWTSIAEMKTAPWPTPKLAFDDATNFDSTNFTLERTPGWFDPGNVAFVANYTGDPSQDYTTGLLAKLNSRLGYSCRIYLPNLLVKPGIVRKGIMQSFTGAFSDASIDATTPTKIAEIKGNLQVLGGVVSTAPPQ
jgi:hypothetical protein